jgi:hypothetical protein
MSVNVQKIFVKLDIVIKMQLKDSELGNLKSRFLPRLCIETHKSMSCLHSSSTEGDVPDESACSPLCISQSEQQPTSTPIDIRCVWLSLFVKYQYSVTNKLDFLNFSLPKLNQLKKKPVTTQLHKCYVYQWRCRQIQRLLGSVKPGHNRSNNHFFFVVRSLGMQTFLLYHRILMNSLH